MKPTNGPYKIDPRASTRIVGAEDTTICSTGVFANNKRHPDDVLAEQESNAAMILEGFTVYHETGLTPREILAQRDELLVFARAFLGMGQSSETLESLAKKARAAIHKTQPQDPSPLRI